MRFDELGICFDGQLEELGCVLEFPFLPAGLTEEKSFKASQDEVVTWLTGLLALLMLLSVSPKAERSLSESASMALSRTSSRPRAVTRIVLT